MKSPFEIRDLIDEARDELYAFAEYEFPRARIDRCFNWFWGYPEFVPFDYEAKLNCLFLPWYLYTYRDDLLRNIGIQFALSKIHDNITRAWIQSCVITPFSFYLVEGHAFPHYLDLKDQLTGRKVQVMDVLASKSLQKGDFFFAKICEAGGYHFFESIYREKLPVPLLSLVKELRSNKKEKNDEWKRFNTLFSIMAEMHEEEERKLQARPKLTLIKTLL